MAEASIDEAVVVGEIEGGDEPNGDQAVFDDRSWNRPADRDDCIRAERNDRRAVAADVRDRERLARYLVESDRSILRCGRESFELGCQLLVAELVRILDHDNDEPCLGVYGKTEIDALLLGKLPNNRHHSRLARAYVDYGDRACERRWDLDNGLGCLDFYDELVDLDSVTDGDEPLDDLCLGEALTDIWHAELM